MLFYTVIPSQDSSEKLFEVSLPFFLSATKGSSFLGLEKANEARKLVTDSLK
jgi:hypothetical protein